MKRVDIMRGLPGSGKSTWAEKTIEVRKSDGVIVSADHYFIKGGKYHFDKEKLPATHDECLRQFIWNLSGRRFPYIIVDNTNIHGWEFGVYWRMAQHLGWQPRIVQVNTPLSVCMKRQTHGVPDLLMGIMWANMMREQVPPYWNTLHINGDQS